MNEAEQAFAAEVSSRKRMASGAKSKTGKRGYVGSVRTPGDLLKGAEKKAYEGTGPVRTSSTFDEIMPFEEFKALPKGRKMIALYEMRKRHSAKAMAEKWGKSEQTVYYYLNALGCRDYKNAEQTAEDDKKHKQAQTAPVEQPQSKEPQPEITQEPPQAVVSAQATVPQSSKSECDFQLHGEWSGAEIAAKLNGLALMTSAEKTYWVNLSWKEI